METISKSSSNTSKLPRCRSKVRWHTAPPRNEVLSSSVASERLFSSFSRVRSPKRNQIASSATGTERLFSLMKHQKIHPQRNRYFGGYYVRCCDHFNNVMMISSIIKEDKEYSMEENNETDNTEAIKNACDD